MKWRLSLGKTVFAGLVLVTAAAVVLLAVFRPHRPDVEPPEEPRIAVTVLEAEALSLEDAVRLPGRVLAWDDLTISVEQAGRIREMPVGEGQRVARGDVLLRVDDRIGRQRLERAELLQRDTARALVRARELHREGALSQHDLEQAESAATAAALAREEAAVELERCTPTAPVDGLVEEHHVSVGEYVTAGRAVVRLLAMETVKVHLDVPERDVHAVAPGQSMTFRCDALPGKHFTGTVQRVAAAAHPDSNAFRVELQAANPRGLLRAGMLAQVDFVRGQLDDVIVLPLAAVVPMEGESVVYVLEAGRAARRIVRIGRILDGRAVLQDGLRAGEQVLLEGNRAVMDGTPVEVKTDWKPAPLPET